MIKTGIALVSIAVGTGFLSAITGTILHWTGRGELEPLCNMIFAAVLMVVAFYAFHLGVSIIEASCFTPFGEHLFKGLRW